MKSVLRLAFILPALLAAAPVTAQETKAQRPAKIRYVTLDRMIHQFAAEARDKQTARNESKSQTVVAQR